MTGQGRRDAIADAETLRLALPESAENAIRWNVFSALDWMRHPDPRGMSHVKTYAAWAASAAFRAVPGLRGE